MMIPNSPGNIGTFWYFVLLPLTAISASRIRYRSPCLVWLFISPSFSNKQRSDCGLLREEHSPAGLLGKPPYIVSKALLSSDSSRLFHAKNTSKAQRFSPRGYEPQPGLAPGPGLKDGPISVRPEMPFRSSRKEVGEAFPIAYQRAFQRQLPSRWTPTKPAFGFMFKLA